MENVCDWIVIAFVGKISTNSTKQLRDVFSDYRNASLETIIVSGNAYIIKLCTDEVVNTEIGIAYCPHNGKMGFIKMVLPCTNV